MKKLILSALMLAATLSGAVPAHAQGGAAERYVSGDTSNAPPGTSGLVVAGTVTEISGSVVLVEEDPASDTGAKGFFAVTDETEITLRRDGESVPGALGDLALGQRVEASYAGAVAESYPTQGDAASIAILEEDPDCPFPGGCKDTATLSFELAVEGEPPAGTAFSGLAELESLISAPLADPDGDGLYTGSMTVPATSAGQGGPPEPLFLPVRIVQDGATVVKDFGVVRIDGDETFEASVSFDGEEPPPPEEEITVTGILEQLETEPVVVDGIEICGLSTHAITDEATGRYYDLLASDSVGLDEYVVERVAVTGTPLPSPAIEEAERCPDLDVTRVEPLDGGGTEPPPPGESATFSFELAVECEPPEGASFFGRSAVESFVYAPLADADGDGVYAGSLTVTATSAGQGGPPEPLSLPVGIVQGTGTQEPDARGPLRPAGPIRLIEDFGTVLAEDGTFGASVSFCDDGGPDGDGNDGGEGPGPVVGGDANHGDVPGGGGPNGGASDSGGIFGGIRILPATGGARAVAGLAGLALFAGGLLLRKVFR